MKKLISLALAALLLLSLAACGDGPAPSSSGSSGDVSLFRRIFSDGRPQPRHHGGGDPGSLWGRRKPYHLHRGVPGRFPGETGNGRGLPQPGLGLRAERHPPPDAVAGRAPDPLRDPGAGPHQSHHRRPQHLQRRAGLPHVETAALGLAYDEQGRELPYDLYGSPSTTGSSTYWAGAGESYPMGMQGRREAIRSAQIDAGGLTVAFAPLADGSDFTAAYCEIPYTEVGLSEDGMTLTVTMHDTFLSSGTLSKDADLDFLKEYGSLYPESFPAGELAGSCTLIENADLRQDGNSAVLTVTLADGPIHGRNFGDGYYRFTAETGYTGIADTGPYLRVILNATDELFAGN